MAKRKPGKYDAVLAGLPALPMEDDPRRQDKIEALQKESGLADLDAVALTARYVVVRRKRDVLKAQESALQLELDAVAQLLIASEDAGVDPAWGAYGANDNTVRLESGDGVRVNKEPSSKVVDPDAFRLWCIANGYERKLQLHAGTRDSVVAERLLAVEPAPDGIEVGSWTKVTFVPAKD